MKQGDKGAKKKNDAKDKNKRGDKKNMETKNSNTVKQNQISLPNKLELRRILFTVEDKDVYIYHFCTQYTGRVLILPTL